MSLFSASTSSYGTDAGNAILPPPAETVRSCPDRQRRLTEYIRAHTGEDITVCLTPYVQTACVTPASEEALTSTENAEFSSKQARQLIEAVDGDYLVLISTHPAILDNLPIDDQLTADRAQQFGYALHELGHIRYTAIADAATLLEERVDDEYQEFVHGLWNSCEDAAIENQLALDQSQLAADRLELVRRSISHHADDFVAEECCEFTFRDAIDTALYDQGIYDTGVRDALCDPDDNRIVFASDADRQAFEQVADSIEKLVATVLSTPNSVERVEHILNWWETVVKPLVDPSEQEKQEFKQPDPDGTTGKSNTSSSSTDQSTDGDTDADHSSSRGEKQDERGTANSASGIDKPDSAERDESVATDRMGETDEIDEFVGSQSEKMPDPDAINTDQRQPSPGADALDYPDIGSDEDADALDHPESNGEGESEPEPAGEGGEKSESQSPIEPTDNTQATESGRDPERALDTAEDAPVDTDTETASGDTEAGNGGASRDTADTVGNSDNDTGSEDGRDTDDATDSGTDAGSHEEMSGSDNGPSSPEDSSDANHGDITDTAGESNEQDREFDSDGATPESQSYENPWGRSNNTSQTSLGSFSTPNSRTESGANSSASGDNDETPSNASDTKRDDPRADAGGANEPESEPAESETGSDPGDITADDGDENSNDEGANIDYENRSESVGDGESNESTIEIASADQKESTATDETSSDANADGGNEECSDTPSESTSESDEQSPEPTPAHAGGDNGLDREGALDTDRDASYDEAKRATPNEEALERDLEDVADALDALEESSGSGAAPGSLSDLTILPDARELDTFTTLKRWGEATNDAEFIGNALRNALKENSRDVHRSGLTSGTFDRRRVGALARGEITTFQVRQEGDNKEYDLVLILDRSISMSQHIQTAEDALVRFVLACNDIGINLSIIDFIHTEARLVKPFSIECEHIRESLLSKQTGGLTPLADALSLGRELLDQRGNSPLVIVVTDGKPGNEDAYHDVLSQSYAPVCGLTLVLDHPRGSVPDNVARNEQFYDRHIYVHEPGQLTERLVQFAVMFNGL